MELIQIDIKNFRSIKDAKITFDHNCLILLGKNEAGKSNVLKAIAALFDKYTLSNKDKRKKIDNEKILEYNIKGIFKLSEKDINEIVKRFNSKFLNSELLIFTQKETLRNYVKTVFERIIIEIDITDGATSQISYFQELEHEFELLNQVYVNGNILSLEKVGYDEFDFEYEIYEIVESLYYEKPYRCHYWQYNDNYLLPNNVSISSFMSSPSNYKALENIFALCNRENIQQEFNDAMNQNCDYANLLKQIYKTVTSTLNKIWKNFK